MSNQKTAYEHMYELGLEQKSCIENEDIAGLEVAFRGLHQAMIDIQLHHAEMPDLSTRENAHPTLQERRGAVRQAILKVEELRQLNARAVQFMLESTRGELNRLGQGRRAAHGYRNAHVRESRFLDSLR